MYAEEEDTGVEAIPILGSDEVDVWEFAWRKEGCPRYLRVQDDGIGVEPAMKKGIRLPPQSLPDESTQTA